MRGRICCRLETEQSKLRITAAVAARVKSTLLSCAHGAARPRPHGGRAAPAASVSFMFANVKLAARIVMRQPPRLPSSEEREGSNSRTTGASPCPIRVSDGRSSDATRGGTERGLEAHTFITVPVMGRKNRAATLAAWRAARRVAQRPLKHTLSSLYSDESTMYRDSTLSDDVVTVCDAL